VRTLANIVDNFRSGEVYNIAGQEYTNIGELSDMILGYLDKDDSQVEYRGTEKHNTLNKRTNSKKAESDLNHRVTVPLDEGIPSTIEWMCDHYDIDR
jgi:dTDP-glucose 4,6-dehydratase